MNVTEDLRPALEFVIARIEQEALRSGEPLNDEQRFLLNNLPTESALPAMDGTDPESPPLVSIPRDLAYECLIALAREARRNDMQLCWYLQKSLVGALGWGLVSESRRSAC
jgi:hypothetical protein